MAILKNDIPILEFDSDTAAVIMPDHEKLGIALPRKAVFAFLGDYVGEYAALHGWRWTASFQSATRLFPIYVGRHGGETLCLCQAPVGAAAAAQLLDWLIGYGVRECISVGSCGTLVDMAENVFLVPERALRDEGASYHYAPPSRYMEVSEKALCAIRKTLDSRGLPYKGVATWSTDGFYRETAAKVAYRREEGCAVVEMECAALAACAGMRGAVWGELLFTADSLAKARQYDPRGFGADAYGQAMELALEAAVNIE